MKNKFWKIVLSLMFSAFILGSCGFQGPQSEPGTQEKQSNPGTEAKDTNKIIFKNWNGDILEECFVEDGIIPVFHGNQPERVSNEKVNYKFDGWYPDLAPVFEDIIYTARFSQENRLYEVTFVNDDDSVLSIKQCGYLEMPNFEGTKPVSSKKKENVKFVFSGWYPKIELVTKNITYKATYEEIPLFSATFIDYDGNVLQKIDGLEYGDLPTYTGEIPVRPSTASARYEFSGWLPEIAEITSNVIYQAQYSSITQQYEIIWKDFDGSILKKEKLDYGKMPIFGEEDPSRESDSLYTYNFNGWYPAIAKVTSDCVYTATYSKRSVDMRTITFIDEGVVLKTFDYKKGEKFNLGIIEKPSKNNFYGWFDKEKNVIYQQSQFSEDLIVKEDTTFYSFFNIQCSNCGGKGKLKVHCKYCTNGRVEASETCSKCHGSGKIEKTISRQCSSCKGKRYKSWKAKCQSCKYNTSIYEPDPWNNGITNCPHCNISTYSYWTITPAQVCPKCSGSGKSYSTQYSTCPNCGGSGDTISTKACSHCDGTGFASKTCSNCHGEGFVLSYMSRYISLHP